MFTKTIEFLKEIIGLSSIAYISGFIIVNTYLLSYGISDLGLLEISYVSAGIVFLFFVIPAVVFPYLTGIESFNSIYHEVLGKYLSKEFHDFAVNNKVLLKRKLGPFVILIFLTVLLPQFYSWDKFTKEMWMLLKTFTLWYLGAAIFARVAVILFNAGFYWRIKSVRSKGPFWSSFNKSFIEQYKISFRKAYLLSSGQEPSRQVIDEQLNEFILSGLSSKGFLASSLYKGIAVLIIAAITFGLFLYPLLPNSVGGGKPVTVNLLIPEEKAIGLTELGLSGKFIEAKDSKDNINNKMLISSTQVIMKTSDAFYLLVNNKDQTKVIELPLSVMEAASYSED